MGEQDELSERFEANRARLKAIAYRMLGSSAEAEDAVQETWLKLSRTDAANVDNLSGWLTTVVARVCLDTLRARSSRQEEPLSVDVEERTDLTIDAECDAVIADGVGLALLVVLDTLSPAERIAFVLHDMFDLPFEEIAPVVGRSAPAARQLASRARRRVRGAPAKSEFDKIRQREVVAAFLAASRAGDFAALLAVLDPDVVMRADQGAIAAARHSPEGIVLTPETAGAREVAETFKGRARNARLALVGGEAGLVFAPSGTPRLAIFFEVFDGRIADIWFVGDRAALDELDIGLVEK